MENGNVKWFDREKGFGFIEPDTGDQDIFVHISAVEKAGLKSLSEGQVVFYERELTNGRLSAQDLSLV